jgi:3-hydroxyacyl-CoA dehydrogenase/enoyl-CoA hydratase/3-hydroxybutyryl-CoA epimerase
MLTEIIMGKKTGDKALAVALDFVRAIRKTPIVVNDSRGFYANRCVLNYIQEGHLMLAEGVPPAMIENVARMAGMPVGPLSLNDEVAIDLAWKIVKATEADLGPQAIDPNQKALLEEMVEKRGRLGRKNGKGFYDYPQSGPKRLWPGLADLQPVKLDPDTIDIQELKHRFLVVQALEAARTVEDKVITDVREADVGSILGFGFAPFTGATASTSPASASAAWAVSTSSTSRSATTSSRSATWTGPTRARPGRRSTPTWRARRNGCRRSPTRRPAPTARRASTRSRRSSPRICPGTSGTGTIA